jgi:hypothetical protein
VGIPKDDLELHKTLEKDKAKRLGAGHGEGTENADSQGYARDIRPEGFSTQEGSESRTSNSGLRRNTGGHPSRLLGARKRGYGIGGGYERPYRKERVHTGDSATELYGPLPHAGYYGDGTMDRPFKRGQAGFSNELEWYKSQYGERTSGYEKKK